MLLLKASKILKQFMKNGGKSPGLRLVYNFSSLTEHTFLNHRRKRHGFRREVGIQQILIQKIFSFRYDLNARKLEPKVKLNKVFF